VKYIYENSHKCRQKNKRLVNQTRHFNGQALEITIYLARER